MKGKKGWTKYPFPSKNGMVLIVRRLIHAMIINKKRIESLVIPFVTFYPLINNNIFSLGVHKPFFIFIKYFL